jgi:site-specific DNA-methyltransferase (adenine-specific)
MNENTIYNQDFLDFARDNIGKEFIDISILSPPYNLNLDYGKDTDDNKKYEDYLSWSEKWMAVLLKITKNTGRFAINIPLDTNLGGHRPVYADLVNVALKTGWKYRNSIIWNENNISRRTCFGSWKSASAPNVISPVEMIAVFYKGAWKRDRKGESTITRDEFLEFSLGHWSFPGEKKKNVGGHPASFPIELPSRLIKLFSYKEDTIFDCFAGSGTTLVAAKQLGRKYLGTEISKEYCEFAKVRLEGTVPVL